MKLPGAIRQKDILKVMIKIGFRQRYAKSSHVILTHPDGRRTLLSMHQKPVSRGELKTILKQVKMTPDEFLSFRKKKK